MKMAATFHPLWDQTAKPISNDWLFR